MAAISAIALRDIIKPAPPIFFARVPSFAIYRDPVQRFVSAYAFARKGGSATVPASQNAQRFACRFSTALECARYIAGIGQTARDRLDPVFRSQTHYLCDLDGRLLVSKLFDLRNVAAHSLSYAGLTFDMGLRENSEQGARTPVVDAELEEIVRHAYRLDFDLEGITI